MNAQHAIADDAYLEEPQWGFVPPKAALPAPRVDVRLATRELAATMILAVAHGFTPEQIANCRDNDVQMLLPAFSDDDLDNRADQWNQLRIQVALGLLDCNEGLAHVDLLLEVLSPRRAPVDDVASPGFERATRRGAPVAATLVPSLAPLSVVTR